MLCVAAGPYMKLRYLALLLAPLAAIYAQSLDVAVVVKAKNSPYWNIVKAGALKAQAELNAEGNTVTVRWDGPEREDQVKEQQQMVSDYISRKVAAIVLAPSNAQALVGPVDAAKNAGIPVIIIDSLIGTESPVAVVATDNYKAGYYAGRQLAESLGGKGKVALFRFMKGHGSTQPREAGFLDAMKKFSGIEVVSSDTYAGASVEEAQKNGAALLAKHGAEIQGVFASNLYASEGMLAALEQAGLAGKVNFVAFDSSDTLVAALRKGELTGLAVQQPFMMGYLGVKSAVAAAQHKSLDHEVDTEVKIVTKANLDSPEVQKLLNPSS